MKTRSILQLPSLILALALSTAPRSQAVNIYWITDTTSAFDVVINGTGLWTGSVDSPNGLWDVASHVWISSNDPFPGYCSLSNGGDTTTYLGTINGISHPAETLQGYADWFPQSGPVQDNDTFFNRYDLPTLFWQGSAPITITSMPNPNDVSTWTWTEEVSGHVLVPEPGTLSLSLVGFGFLAARRFARRRG